MKKHSKAKLKGTVLFTVISVMSLLIIFLTSTLVLATSASNRSHKNYASTQTEYTARAAIESFSEAMSRNDAVAQMIVNMKKTDILTPSVEINDSALGQIGYYDNSGNWVPGQISIEYIDDTYVYNTEKLCWEEQQVLKVTATAELAGEESTVSAYIRKKSPDEPTPLSIKGLQTAGGLTPDTTKGTYTGALALGITADGTGEYQLNNGTIVKTDLTFVNGSLKTGGNLNFDIDKSGTGTVIEKNLKFSTNPLTINLNYEMTGDFVQKDIPYLYVNGEIENGELIKVQGKNSPYNIFCGSWQTKSNNFDIKSSDLYLMDTGTTSTIGCTGTSMLKAWSTSLIQKSNTQFDSKGGNIYSKGNIELSNIKIYGDVRCEKDITIGSSVIIYGDLVCGGNLTVNEGSIANIVKGQVYKREVSGNVSVLKPGYTAHVNVYHENELRPDCVEKESFSVDNAECLLAEKEILQQDGAYEWHYVSKHNGIVTDFVWADGIDDKTIYWIGDDYYTSKPYYQVNPDGFQTKEIVTESKSIYQVNYDDTYIQLKNGEAFVYDADGNPLYQTTDKQYHYYHNGESGWNEVLEEDAKKPYYTEWNDPTNTIYTKDLDGTINDTIDVYFYEDATNIRVDYNTSHIDNIYKDLSEYTYASDIYPKYMTREAITGKDSSGNPYPDSKQEYKFVTNLDEIQKSIGYIGSTFDPSVYLTAIPDGIDVSTVYDINNLSSDETINITDSCTIKGDNGSGHSVIINIKPTGTVWVNLDNVTLQRNSKIVVDDSHGSVNFLVNGHLLVQNSTILTKKIDDGNKNITDSDKIGITFYGTPDSEIEYKNMDTICGTAKCPYTKLNISDDGGALDNVKYNGEDVAKPHWIGNALFKEIGNSGDDFTLLYTDAGGSSDSTITNQLLDESWEIMYYDMY